MALKTGRKATLAVKWPRTGLNVSWGLEGGGTPNDEVGYLAEDTSEPRVEASSPRFLLRAHGEKLQEELTEEGIVAQKATKT